MKILELLYSTCLALIFLSPAAGIPNQSDQIMTPFSMLKTFLGLQEDTAQQAPQDLLLIGPGFGRTGTSSFMTALGRIGLKSYHMSAVMRTPGHLQMWTDYIQGRISVNDVIDALSTAGFNATASMPACYLYKELLERYPNARVVLTVRGDGDGMAWAKSVKGSIGLLRPAIERVPWRWIPKIQLFKGVIFPWIFGKRNVSLDENYEFKAEDLARMYNEWVAEVKATVPEKKLLVFAPKDGWKPLCEFLSPLNEQVKMNCDEILKSGEAYPWVNEKEQFEIILGILRAISTAFEYGPLVLAVVTVVWFVMKMNEKNKAKQA